MRKPMLVQYNVVFTVNPALQAKVTRLLIREKTDFQSMIAAKAGDKTRIRFLAPKNEVLLERLRKLGTVATTEPVFRPEPHHRRRKRREQTKTGTDEAINVLSLYSVVEGEHMRIVLAVENPSDVAAVVEKLGYRPDKPAFD